MSGKQEGPPAARGWNLDARWQARIDGTDCEFCKWDQTTGAHYPVEIARLRASRWLLGANQYIRGYSVLMLDRHAIELHDLSPDLRQAFTEDIADAARASARVLDPIKMNIEMQGNVVPHLHCHLKPRFPDDRPGHARIFQGAEIREIPLADMERLAAKLRGQLPK
jgi:diadenosine tetraphosphate (Ap4A) HIT family hydrolase